MSHSGKDYQNHESMLCLYLGARVYVVTNINVGAGLANGTSGEVVGFVWHDPMDYSGGSRVSVVAPHTQTTLIVWKPVRLPQFVLIRVTDPQALARTIAHGPYEGLPSGVVPIAVTGLFPVKHVITTTLTLKAKMKQFPLLVNADAVTYNKMQSATISGPLLVDGINKTNINQAYTGITRVTQLFNLYLRVPILDATVRNWKLDQQMHNLLRRIRNASNASLVARGFVNNISDEILPFQRAGASATISSPRMSVVGNVVSSPLHFTASPSSSSSPRRLFDPAESSSRSPRKQALMASSATAALLSGIIATYSFEYEMILKFACDLPTATLVEPRQERINRFRVGRPNASVDLIKRALLSLANNNDAVLCANISAASSLLDIWTAIAGAYKVALAPFRQELRAAYSLAAVNSSGAAYLGQQLQEAFLDRVPELKCLLDAFIHI